MKGKNGTRHAVYASGGPEDGSLHGFTTLCGHNYNYGEWNELSDATVNCGSCLRIMTDADRAIMSRTILPSEQAASEPTPAQPPGDASTEYTPDGVIVVPGETRFGGLEGQALVEATVDELAKVLSPVTVAEAEMFYHAERERRERVEAERDALKAALDKTSKTLATIATWAKELRALSPSDLEVNDGLADIALAASRALRSDK